MEQHFIIMNREQPILDVRWTEKTATSEWLGPHHIKIPLGLYPENITFKDIMAFCESRQPPRTRIGIDELLHKKYNLPFYLPLQMCQKSRGITMADYLWMKFDGDDITYEDIKIRD